MRRRTRASSTTPPRATARRRTWPRCCSCASPESTWCMCRTRAARRRCSRCSRAIRSSRSPRRRRCCRWCRPAGCGRWRSPAATRTPLMPGVPGMAEAGLPDYEIGVLVRLLRAGGHAGRAWCSKLFEATSQAPQAAGDRARSSRAKAPRRRARLRRRNSPSFLVEDAKLWARLVKESGAKAE